MKIAISLASLLFFVGLNSGCKDKTMSNYEGEESDKSMTKPSMTKPSEVGSSYGAAEEESEEMPAVVEPMNDEIMASADSAPKAALGRAVSEKKMSEAPGGGKDVNGKGGIGGELGPVARAWFPETFLFDPLVVTDDTGNASVSVRVPDRLTTWRVLGLAHSRSGQQAGTTVSFDGSLPAYVDPIVPSFLRAGDRVSVPVQLINNSEEALSTTLTIQVEGGSAKTSSWQLSIPARSSSIRYVDLTTDKPGQLRLLARMGKQDMVVRDVTVLPVGKPSSQRQSGTLAAPREFSLTSLRSEKSSKGKVALTVFPGALALLRSELQTSLGRGGLASDAFALLLAGKAPTLLQALGEKPDNDELRKMAISATQRIMKHARVLSIDNAALIAEAAASHPDNPVLARLSSRAIATIESSQAPDGTCGGQSGWTLQRLLVATADCSRAAKDSPKVTIRARGSFERHAKDISDGYTAAAILATHGATGEFSEKLQMIVLDSIATQDDGSKILKLEEGVVRADGRRPSVVEATALAVLALRDVPDAPLADLGATILAAYSPAFGWGDGRANLVSLEAAIVLFSDPIPELVRIELRKDGDVIAAGNLERQKVRESMQLLADNVDIGGTHQWIVSATPAVPGLGFSLTTTNWAPWTVETAIGTELELSMPDKMQVGKAAELQIQAIAPSGMAFSIEFALPAGFQVDETSLRSMVQSGALSDFKKADGKLTLVVAPLQPAKRFSQTLRVIPTLAGRLQSGPTSVLVGNQRGQIPPSLFVVQ